VLGRLAVGLVSSLALASPTFAEASDGDEVDEEIDVPADLDAPKDPGRQTAFVRVVEAAELPPAADLARVLESLPGVELQQSGTREDWTVARVRGAQARHLRVEIDGLPLDASGTRAVDLSRIPVALVERIELIPAGAQGASPVGGTLRIVLSERPGGWAQLGIGSFGSLSLDTGLGFAKTLAATTLKGRLMAHVSSSAGGFAHFDDGGTPFNVADDGEAHRANNDARSVGVRGELELGRAGLRVAWEARERGLPGAVGLPTPGARSRGQWGQADLRGRMIFDGWSLEIGGTGSYAEDRMADPGAYLALPVQPWTERRWSVSAEADAELAWSARQWSRLHWSGGAEGWGAADDLLWRPRSRLELAHEARVFEDRLSVAPWLALEVLGASGDSGPSLPVTGGLGLRWSVAQGLWLKAAVRAGIRPPSLSELNGRRGAVSGNPELLPERGVQAEVGVQYRWALAAWRLELDAAAFLSEHQQLVVWVQNPARVSRPVNLGRARTLGGEMSVALEVGPARLGGSITAQLPRNLDPRQPGLRLPGSAPFQSRLFAAARIGPVRADAGWSFLGGRYHDLANLDPSPARHRLDLAISWQIVAALRVGLDLENLLDARAGPVPLNPADPDDPRRRSAPIDDLAGFPLPGRSFFVVVEVAG
jgi:outer membrane cobalamin receptor